MSVSDTGKLRNLPPIDAILKQAALRSLIEEHGHNRALGWARESLGILRKQIAASSESFEREELIVRALREIDQLVERDQLERLDHVINATGVVLHTNLGRAPLADRAIEAVQRAARYGNVEMDLATGERRYRGHQIDALWRELTGAEACLMVNNCAAATMLALQSLAAGREVIVSRGQLIEIGGSYRLPDVFTQSGAILREVGTTNRTRLADYESALGPNCAGILRVHPSNYRVVGFTEEVDIGPLAELARRHQLLSIDDVGSGCLTDLRKYGLPEEPIVGQSLAAGADLVVFSGDKLLGGPQCGILLGKKSVIDRTKKSPLARAMRVDKMTLAALQATLEIHLAGQAETKIPVIRALAQSAEELKTRAESLLQKLNEQKITHQLEVIAGRSAVGGGSIPTAELSTWLISLEPKGIAADEVARKLRTGTPHVVPRVEKDLVLLDLRTILPGEEEFVVKAVAAL